MKARPEGALVRITYDPNPGDELATGDLLRTKTGRTYVVMEIERTRRGRNPHRLSLRCVVAGKLAEVDLPEGAKVYPLRWYSRDATRPRRA